MESGERNEPTLEVHFHALISDRIKFQPNSQTLFIAFKSDQSGSSWDTLSREISDFRYSDSRLKIRYTEKLPLRFLNTRYKYAIYEKATGLVMWEAYGTGVISDRILKIPDDLKSIDVWHQYDGVIEKKSESFPSAVTDAVSNWYYNTLPKNAEKTVSAFFLESREENSQFSLNQIRMLLYGMRSVYLTDNKCWSGRISFEKFITKQCLTNLEETCKALQDRNHKVVAALYVLIALFDDAFLNLEDSDATVFSRILFVTADKKRRTCPEVDIAVERLPDKCQSIHSGIEAVVRHILKNTKDPSWLYLMPWIHILSGKCKPFDHIPMDIKHDTPKPEWWGTETCDDLISRFKRQSWTIPPNDMLSKIVPLFEMDYLLPRTFMTTLELKDIEELIETEYFPLEACIANIVYHLRGIMNTNSKDKKKELKVETCMQKLLGILQNADAEGNITEIQWQIAYKIASHLIGDCVQTLLYKCKNAIVWNSVQIFVRCIGMFDKNCQDKASEHMKELETVATRVLVWMSEKKCLKDSPNRENYMEVWKHLFVKDGVSSEAISKAWNEKMLADLSEKLQKQRQTNRE